MDVVPLVRQPLGESVAQQLRRQIVSGSLAAGSRLVEDSLSEAFGVSRGPIRDALRTMENEGLVETRRRGVWVVGIRDVDIDELYDVRTALETVALTRAVESAGSHLWAPFPPIMAALTRAADDGDADRYAAADLDFHTALYRCSGSRRLRSLWDQLQPTFAVLLAVTNAEDHDLGPSKRSHEAILLSAQAGNTGEAVTELRLHLNAASQRLRLAHGRAAAANSRQAPA